MILKYIVKVELWFIFYFIVLVFLGVVVIFGIVNVLRCDW